MLIVHHLNNSRSQRVLWLLEELELPYEIKFYERDPVTRLAPPALRAVHPLGKSPVLVDGDVTVAETGAIVEYLAEKSGGRLRPEAGTPERRRWTYWMHFAEGSLMPQVLLDLVLASAPDRAPAPMREAAKAITDGARQGYVAPNLKSMFDLVEAELAKSSVVGRRGLFGGRCDDELSARDGGHAHRRLRRPSQACGLRRTDPRPPSLSEGSRKRRSLRLCRIADSGIGAEAPGRAPAPSSRSRRKLRLAATVGREETWVAAFDRAGREGGRRGALKRRPRRPSRVDWTFPAREPSANGPHCEPR